MANFTKGDLKQDYAWKTKEEPAKKIEGFPADVVLNCSQGYEVLHFLNRYMDDLGWVTIISFNNIEFIIKARMPFGKRTHKEVKDWLDSLLRR
ncbi:hypothetical protein [uncultured Flavobacterium sp.]|uniref:hypothetical protein n=1 Tax=uncultured Flavobacterium sp. TaxID=165435 RepID=UPI0025E88E82|nr:hypothetical protein [uncultured Flavobacterium sp.]